MQVLTSTIPVHRLDISYSSSPLKSPVTSKIVKKKPVDLIQSSFEKNNQPDELADNTLVRSIQDILKKKKIKQFKN